jgi:hypothetical protein
MISRSARIGAYLSCLAFALSGVSCGGPPNHYHVTGKVICDGEPAEGADVAFHLKGDADRDPHIPHGVCDENGVFTLECRDGPGALPGNYYVCIRWMDFQSPEGRKARGKGQVRFKAYPEDLLDNKYANPKDPKFFATVKSEKNELSPFEISRKGIKKSYVASKKP